MRRLSVGLKRGAVRLGGETRGAAAVEFALIAPVLLLIMAGLVDGSRFIVQTMQVNAAAQAGADFAQRKGWNATGIQAAVTAATPLTITAAPAPTQTTGCVVSGAIVAPTGAACPAGGGSPGNFVTVSAQKPFTSLLKWPGLAAKPTITAQAVVRIP